jgi:two-component system nitrogen regulation response regulator GlnG
MNSRASRILIVDDEEAVCDVLFRLLERQGYMPTIATNGETALEMVRLGIPDLMLLDIKMPGIDGMEVLRAAKKMAPNLPVFMITAWGGIDGAVEAMKQGAHDYLIKPLNRKDLIARIQKTLKKRNPDPLSAARSDHSRAELFARFRQVFGPSEGVAEIISEIVLVGPSDFSVVIQGETGTGKELVARAIHETSLRADKPIIPVDCGAIPETLFESELFGYEKGAFTGAVGEKAGKFEMAQGGTLFMDEISNLPLASQTKLLRAIQEKSFFKVGGTKPVNVDVRLITATNMNLTEAVKTGKFSRDLFYRLSEFTITVPPLRERMEDIIHIADKIIEATNHELGKSVQGFSEAALTALIQYKWPGNVRELRSAIRRAVLHADTRVEPEHLALHDTSCDREGAPAHHSDFPWEGLSLKEIVRRNTIELERAVLVGALKKTGGNKAKAARLLQIDYTTIHAKIKQYGIRLED